jgi:hypothetical protein
MKWRALLLALVLVSCVGLLGASARAQDSSKQPKKPQAQSQSQPQVIRSYPSKSDLQIGLLVQLASKKSQQQQAASVIPATQKKAKQTLGVVVPANAAPIAISNSSSGQQAFVATGGNFRMLVSDQNGAIQQGDYLAVSSVSGIGMKAGSSASVVAGKAVSGFDGQHQVIGSGSVEKSNGKSSKVHFGYIEAILQVAPNPIKKHKKQQHAKLPGFLASASSAIANKHVSASRIYLSLGVLFVTLVVLVALLYAGVRTSMMALGRNPMAKKSIMRGMLQVVITGITVLIIGLFAVYLLLKL